jgi:hypothetical protein
VLGTTRFSIRGHHHATIRIRLTAAGRRFRKRHRKVISVDLITKVRAGKAKMVTFTTPMKVRRP